MLQFLKIPLNDHATSWNDPWKDYLTLDNLRGILAFRFDTPTFCLFAPRFCVVPDISELLKIFKD